MVTFANGEIPYSVVSVVLATGTDSNGYWEFRCTPAFAARWAQAKRNAERMFGRTIYIRTGWNIYRPLGVQVNARKRACDSGNCAGASVPGYSSHGGNWGGRDCLAVDVDPNGLTWDQVDQAMEAAGFSARLITERMSGIPGGERWHYIDFNAFGPAPAGTETGEFDTMATKQEIKDAIVEVLREVKEGPGGRNHWDTQKFLASMTAQAVNAAAGARADLNYIHQLSPYSLKAILEASGKGEIVLTDEQVAVISGQLSASAVAGIDAALRDDFEGVKALLSELPEDTIAALKAAL